MRSTTRSSYWVREYPLAFGGQYEVTDMVWFNGGIDTGCGTASSQTGPFYCPADHLVYFDIDFLQQLQDQLGATGDLATQYIVAHEVGHHVQTLNGTNQQVQQASGEQQRMLGIAPRAAGRLLRRRVGVRRRCAAATRPVRISSTPTSSSRRSRPPWRSATTTIQMHMQGRVDDSTWTHGSSEQRVSWFRRGYSTGDPTQCDTFAEV